MKSNTSKSFSQTYPSQKNTKEQFTRTDRTRSIKIIAYHTNSKQFETMIWDDENASSPFYLDLSHFPPFQKPGTFSVHKVWKESSFYTGCWHIFDLEK